MSSLCNAYVGETTGGRARFDVPRARRILERGIDRRVHSNMLEVKTGRSR
jgi:hypothetical protein